MADAPQDLCSKESVQLSPNGEVAYVHARWTYEYDPEGRVVLEIEEHNPDGERPSWTTDRTEFEYDESGRLLLERRVSVGREQNVPRETEYEYEGSRLVLRRDVSHGVTTRYRYDGRGRRIEELEAIESEPIQRTRIRYDQQGREIARIVTHRPFDESSVSTETTEYRDAGRTIIRYGGNAAAVRSEGAVRRTEVYDAVGRLKSIRGDRDGDDEDDVVITMHHDPFGRLVREVSVENGYRFARNYRYDRKNGRLEWIDNDHPDGWPDHRTIFHYGHCRRGADD